MKNLAAADLEEGQRLGQYLASGQRYQRHPRRSDARAVLSEGVDPGMILEGPARRFPAAPRRS